MFNWRRKEPEKPKPNFTGEQHEHKACLMLFDGTRAHKEIDSFRNSYGKITVIKDKTIDRLRAMIDSCDEISSHHIQLQRSCITSVQIAKNVQEMMAMQMGLIPTGEIQGIGICPGCLQQAIISCEEVLNSLKDIEIATKEYV